MKVKKRIIQLFLIVSILNYEMLFAAEQKNITVFLTGAAGFIGSNFLEYMFDKYPDYHFLILDKLTYAGNLSNIPHHIKNSSRFEFVHGSINNVYLVEDLMKRADLVVHFAAESHVTNSIFEDAIFFETDVLGTRVLMRSLVVNNRTIKRFVHISTSEVYGTAETEPITEEHPLNPRSPYASAKTGADRLVYSYWCTYDIPAVIIRPFNNYGPRQHLEKVVPFFITNALKGESITVHGSGLQTRDWLHVHDTCRAIDKVLHRDNFEEIKNQVINIGTGRKVSILDISHEVVKHLGISSDVIKHIEDRPGQVECHISSLEKSKKLLDWEPQKTFKEGLAETVEWYRMNSSWWNTSLNFQRYLVRSQIREFKNWIGV